ncbi:MAG: hypothetical protein ABW101_16240 [Candidatus Thiodiazotropha sp.]
MKFTRDKVKAGDKKYYVIRRIILIFVILLLGGVMYSLAGGRHESGDIPVAGILLTAIFFPWEWLFLDKFK